MARIARPSETTHTPADLEEVSRYIEEIGRLQRQIEEGKIRLNEDIARLKQEALDRDLPLEKRINELTDAIERFTDAKWAELFSSHNRKSIQLTSGSFGKRLSGPWVMVKDEEAAVAELKKRKLEELIRVVESVRKDMVKRKPELVAGIESIIIKPKDDMFFISPTEVDTVEEESE